MATASNSRKMRRTREASAVESSNLLSGFDLYGVQGDSCAALEVFSDGTSSSNEETSLAAQYNCLLLSQLAKINQHQQGTEIAVFMKQMEEMERLILSKKREHLVSTRKVKRNEFVLAYNRALCLYATGLTKKCAAICADKLSPILSSKQAQSDELDFVASRMAFLLLECILALAVGKNSGLHRVVQAASEYSGTEIPQIEKIVEWLELLDTEKEPQIKFMLPVYKSRLALAEFDEAGKRVDSHIRSARKDMKTAMEVFQQKLRPSFGCETDSVVSSANSEENMSSAGSRHHQVEPQPPAPSSVVLQKLNQSALSLKAHLEQLKGNTKKSLILCGEALGATTSEEDTAAYEAFHSNNLAVVYETNNRRHLALHALAKSLRANSKNISCIDKEGPTMSTLFLSDGTVRSDQTLSILYNAAICALRARNYTSAYECTAACISRSDVFRGRPGCWLRMAEASIGIFTDLRRQNNRKKFSTVDVDGESQGIVVDNAVFTDDVGVVREELVATLGSPEDFEQVKRNPLLRARTALEHVIRNGDQLEADALMSARLSISYVHLAFGDHRSALAMAKIVLEAMESVIANDSNESDTVRRLHKKQIANARMYAAEASCALGVDAMAFLVGDGKDDAFDRLASDLSGVTFETASTSDQAKRRLAKAQTMVRSSACAVSAVMGNNRAAKQLAHSANAMEDAYSSNRERSSARRALIYTLLREGNQSSALTMLLSLR